MRNSTLKATLSALLVSVPLAGAFAEPYVDNPYADRPYVDSLITSSVGANPGNTESYARLLDSQLRAVESNLEIGRRNSDVDLVEVGQVRSAVHAIRQAAAQEETASGGVLGEAAYRSLSDQVRALNQNVHVMRGG